MQNNIYNIPMGRPFLPSFVHELMKQQDDFAEMVIVMPTRRACRSLKECFIDFCTNKSLILPKIIPLGDLTGQDILCLINFNMLSSDDIQSFLNEVSTILPLKRQLILTRLLKQASDKIPSLAHAFHLATDLCTLLDQCYAEEKSFTSLAQLVPENYAAHWQMTLDFLKIITHVWPKILEDEQALDRADYRNQQFRLIEKIWLKSPPQKRMIFAGVNLALPAAADMVKAALTSSKTMLVLAGLDQQMSLDYWQDIEATHPQYLLKNLLDRYELNPQDILSWGGQNVLQREDLLRQVFSPASQVKYWQNLAFKNDIEKICENIHYLEADHVEEESFLIALRMRGYFAENDEGKAALVTLDRALAQKVTDHLKKWDIHIDDSAGKTLDILPIGSFAILLLEFCRSPEDPVKLMALLKHFLCSLGLENDHKKSLLSLLEISYLRERHYPGSLVDLHQLLLIENDEKLVELIEYLQAALYDLTVLSHAENISLNDCLEAHLKAMATLSQNAQAEVSLWQEDEAEEFLTFIANLQQQAHIFESLTFSEYETIFGALLSQESIREKTGMTERLSILGPMESRLQDFNLVILGGMNEKMWPPDVSGDPWMSRQMREEFGLTPLEQRIGIAAHDFYQLFSADEVLLTRSLKVDGSPSMPSRWIQRFEAILAACGSEHIWQKNTQKWFDWARSFYHTPVTESLSPPAPTPRLLDRPMRLSVTEIEKWRRNPYQIYARHILKLKALESIGHVFDEREKGSIFHDVFEQFLREHSKFLPDNAPQLLATYAQNAFQEMTHDPRIKIFWARRFDNLIEWFIDQQKDRNRKGIFVKAVEEKGCLEIETPKGIFRLVGRIDRLDQESDHAYDLIDYKTGTPPTQKDIRDGFAPQLPLEAIMIEKNAFENIPSQEVKKLSYWHLKGDASFAEISCLSDKEIVTRVKNKAFQGLLDLIAQYQNEQVPYLAYPNFANAPRFDDYKHLCRVEEWRLNVKN